jgi:O-antigen ligase
VDLTERLYRPWSFVWGLWILAGLFLLALKVGHWKSHTPRWLLALPIVWMVWQCLAALQTIDAQLTRFTLPHFMACVTCLFIGWYGLSQAHESNHLWAGLIIGFLLVLWYGFSQHYGGLEAMRRAVYEQPNWQALSPEFLKRLAKGRIYSTLVYPNALAGLILLVILPCSIALWRMSRRLGNVLRGVLVGSLFYVGLACLVWSGSKAGWLIGLGLGLVALLHLPLEKPVKGLVLGLVLVLGLAGFFVKYAGYFQRGATSVSARFDYWRAALHVAVSHPILGTGPGTFSIAYKRVKAPESEMARLVHNDFLEQASDSGLVGFLAYSGLIFGSLIYLYRKRHLQTDRLRFAVWLGLLGWAAQSFVEFGLYIPALAWPAFVLLGWLLGGAEQG